MRVDDSQLKAFILDQGLIDKDVLSGAEHGAKREGKTLADVILEKKLLAEDKLLRLVAYIRGIPTVDLQNEVIDQNILTIIPEPVARKNSIVAYRLSGGDLEVAMLDPDDIQTVDFIKKTSGLRVLPRLTSPESLNAALKQYQKTLETEFGQILRKEAEGVVPVVTGAVTSEDLKKKAEELPIVKIVDTLVHHAILQDASDIHIEPAEKELIVRYRVDGILHDATVLPRQLAEAVVARIKVLSNLKLDEHRLPQDGRFKVETKDLKVSIRVSVIPVFDGEKIVLRLLPETAKGFTLERLGFRQDQIEEIHRAIKKTTGIVLVTGPTGSGKTTTLYTLIDILNKAGVNISTVEDPIEYRIPRINQTQVKPDIGLSFANGLRSLLRQDPNIIMVGEIRDNETAGLAINAALTGHLVLSTIHTNNAAGALPRLLDMKVEPFLIASTVVAITAQRLVRTICPEHTKAKLTDAEISVLEKEVDLERIISLLRKEKIVAPKANIRDILWPKPKPGDECPDGYKGRIGIHEIILLSEKIKELILKNASAGEIDSQARNEGMVTMLEDGFIKAAQGITTIEEVLRVTSE
ncbi:MAG: Flp pilus assembly complex ATPase component TadA [Candidatus Sungbacteria bacterium]|nr:Flp pilus assembly complex ATPase component TadA [Candidatus Sungbacteria bacterium]